MALWLLVIFLLIANTNGYYQEPDTNERELIRNLLENYDKRARPITNHREPITIWINPSIYSLVDINEKQETLTFFQWLPMNWNDAFLQWNPDEFDNITEIGLIVRSIWTPDIIIFNAVNAVDVIPFEETLGSVDYMGNVTAVRVQVITARCKFQLLAFPYDIQNCTLQMGSWAYQKHQIRLKNLAKNFPMKVFHENSEWNILNIESETVEAEYSWNFPNSQGRQFEEVHYHVILKRKPYFYFFVMVVPSFIITSITLLGLFSPSTSIGERQEKVTLGLTNLLTMAVMLQLVADAVPKSAEGLPLLAKYILFELGISSFSTCITVVILFIHQNTLVSKRPVPKWWFGGQNVKKEGQNDTKFKASESKKSIRFIENAQIESIIVDVENCCQVLLSMKETLENAVLEKSRCEIWTRIFDKIDLFFVLLTMFANISVTIYIFYFLA